MKLTRPLQFASIAFAGALGLAAPALAQTATSIVGAIKAQCDVINYDDDCLAAITKGITDVAALTDADKATVYTLIRGYTTRHAYLAPRINEILTNNNIPLTDEAAGATPAAATPGAGGTPGGGAAPAR